MRKTDHFLQEGLMQLQELNLKDRKDLQNWMHRIACNGNAIKRAARAFQVDEDTYLQMQELVNLVTKAKTLMDILKSVPPQDDNAVRDIFIDPDSDELVQGRVVLIPNGTEPREEVEEET
jgi:hypothetical protein